MFYKDILTPREHTDRDTCGKLSSKIQRNDKIEEVLFVLCTTQEINAAGIVGFR